MERIARFEKVSYERFKEDWLNKFKDCRKEEVFKIYEEIKLPKRATKGSAGYDIFAPEEICLKPNQTITVPTGIRIYITEGWVLKIYPRSSLGFKYRLQLDNTVGIIDSDYYYSDNEGHLFIKLTNCTNEDKTLVIPKSSGFAQGIFVQYGITFDDEVTQIRNGGLYNARYRTGNKI